MQQDAVSVIPPQSQSCSILFLRTDLVTETFLLSTFILGAHQVIEFILLSSFTESSQRHWVIRAQYYFWNFTKLLSHSILFLKFYHSCSVVLLRTDQVAESILLLSVHQVIESFLLNSFAESWPGHWAIPAHYCYWEFTKSLSHSCSLLALGWTRHSYYILDLLDLFAAPVGRKWWLSDRSHRLHTHFWVDTV